MSTRETILAAIATALSGVASGRVYRTRQEQIATLPTVVIEPQAEEAEEVTLGKAARRLTVGIAVYARGDTPDNAADATLAAIWSALYATPDLGQGATVQLEPGHSVSWDFDEYDYTRAVLSVTYSYTTSIGSM